MSKDDPKNPDSQPYNDPPTNPRKKGNPYGATPEPFNSPQEQERRKKMMKNPKNFGKSKDVVFDTSWDLMKFGDCPVCLGDPMACPSPDVPMSVCGTRRNAIKHMMRGKGGRPPITLHR